MKGRRRRWRELGRRWRERGEESEGEDEDYKERVVEVGEREGGGAGGGV